MTKMIIEYIWSDKLKINHLTNFLHIDVNIVKRVIDLPAHIGKLPKHINNNLFYYNIVIIDDLTIKPYFLYNDPFNKGHYIAVCDINNTIKDDDDGDINIESIDKFNLIKSPYKLDLIIEYCMYCDLNINLITHDKNNTYFTLKHKDLNHNKADLIILKYIINKVLYI